jgi:hypothetical protein
MTATSLVLNLGHDIHYGWVPPTISTIFFWNFSYHLYDINPPVTKTRNLRTIASLPTAAPPPFPLSSFHSPSVNESQLSVTVIEHLR